MKEVDFNTFRRQGSKVRFGGNGSLTERVEENGTRRGV